MIEGTLKGVTHFTLGWQRTPTERVCVGDAAALIPPFTGNGMTMAIQGAVAIADDVAAWSRGVGDWASLPDRVRTRQRKAVGRRLRWARAFQAVMLRRGPRRLAMSLVASGLIRFESLYTKVR